MYFLSFYEFRKTVSIYIIKITGRNQVFALFCDSLRVYNHYIPSKEFLKKKIFKLYANPVTLLMYTLHKYMYNIKSCNHSQNHILNAVSR